MVIGVLMNTITDIIIDLVNKNNENLLEIKNLNKKINEISNKSNEFKLWHEEEVKHTTKLMSYVKYLQDVLYKNKIVYNHFKA